MIWLRIIWGAVLAALLGYSFRRAWRLEHGTPDHSDHPFIQNRGTETYVLFPPTALFWILLIFFVMYAVSLGFDAGAVRFTALLADIMLTLSIYFLLLLVLLPFLRTRISARACAVLWLVPAFLSWQAHMLINIIPIPTITLYIPRSAIPVIEMVWLAGFAIVGGYYLISHLIFSREVRKNSVEETDEEVLKIWVHEQEVLDYTRPVRLLRGDVPAPFSMGRTGFSRCTVLPKHDYSPSELSIIFRHELHHLQRSDVDTKVFLCLCRALCWFNPLVWIAAKKAAEDLERSCDEIVTTGMDDSERRAYANLLLDTAAPGRGCTTCLSAAAQTLRYRLKSVITPRKRATGTILLMAAVFACVLFFGTVSLSDAKGRFSELILTEDIKISYVYDSKTYDTVKNVSPRFFEALDTIELEHITGELRPDTANDSPHILFSLSDGRLATLTDRFLYLHDHTYVNRRTDCYLIRSDVDIEELKASIYTY